MTLVQIHPKLSNYNIYCRIANYRGLWRGPPPDALGPGTPALRVHGGGERGPGHAQESRHQGLGTRRRQVLPGKTGQHWISRLNKHSSRQTTTSLSCLLV